MVLNDAEVALGFDGDGLLDEEARHGLTGNAGGEDGAGRLLDLGWTFGKPDGARPGATARAHLPLYGDAGAEFARGENRRRGRLSEKPAGCLKAGAPKERLSLVFEEAHGGRFPG